jgi:hypothetical protein
LTGPLSGLFLFSDFIFSADGGAFLSTISQELCRPSFEGIGFVRVNPGR